MRSRKKLAVTNRLRKVRKQVKKMSLRRHLQFNELNLANES